MNHQEIIAALTRVRPGAQWNLSGETLDGLVWMDASPKPTAEELGL